MASPDRPFFFPTPQTERHGKEHLLARVIIACAAVAHTGTVAAADGFQVLLRNDLTPGSLSSYRVRIQGVRTTPTLRYEEKLRFEQTGRLMLIVLEPAPQRAARQAWMMELDAPVVVSLTRADQPVEGTFAPKAVGLPPAAAQLRTAQIDARTARASPVGGSLVQRAGMLLALDFAQWPAGLVRPGDTWQTPTQRDELQGVWTHRYTKTEGLRARRLAVGDFEFAGRLAGTFAEVAVIERVEGTWKWRVAKRGLQSSSADVVLSYGERENPRQLAMHVELELQRRRRLPRPQLAKAKEELAELNALAGEITEAPGEETRDALAQFVEEHPNSLWLPVARHLLERIAADERRFAALDKDAIAEALTSLITRWQAVALAGDLEPLQPLRATFRRLVKTNRDTLYELAGADDTNTRAMAVFCVAFGDRPEDLARVVAACQDEVARVRAWAAYGLAERRDTNVEPAVLRALLADADDKVRQRACMAVQACVRRDSPHRELFITLLLDIVRKDESHAVRPRAAQALDALAIPQDLPILIEAEHQQEVPAARRRLEATIRRLGGTPKEVPDE